MPTLPDRPNLEQLKKQSKSLLHQAQAGDVEALRRFAGLPAFTGRTPAELASAGLALHDAQSVIAREHGFTSWNALRDDVEARMLSFEAAIDEFVRCASGRSAPAAGGVHASTRVSDRDGASAAAPGATTDSCRSGSAIVADGPAALGADPADAQDDDADRWTAPGSGSAAAPAAAWRWTGRPTRSALDVSDATAWVGAATSPDGASGVTSCPSWPTIGGSGRAPGTSARNDPAGATTGGSPLTRWIGGSDDHAPVGGASVGGAREAVASGVGSGSAGAASERPNGHGRRTVTPPQ